jgi:hypothetical protein
MEVSMFGKIAMISIAVLSLDVARANTALPGKYKVLMNNCNPNVPVGSVATIKADDTNVVVTALRPASVQESHYSNGPVIETLFNVRVGHFYTHNMGSGAHVSDGHYVDLDKFTYVAQNQRFDGESFQVSSEVTLFRNGEKVILRYKSASGIKNCFFAQ